MRGHHPRRRRPTDYKEFILPLVYYKSISDEFEVQYEQNVEEYGEEFARQENLYDIPVVPEGYLWENHFAERMNVEYEKIEVRNQRTKWGSCSSNGTLGLNWRLLMAPPEIMDYVVVHELAHLREANHSSEFWSLVAEHDPEYESHSEWLTENSARLVFSEDDL